uniref:Uncharacterized protein n=1 Tax=Ditylenchus dipsaci TaxID=166011 RepID=A0A915E8K7_9BILA
MVDAVFFYLRNAIANFLNIVNSSLIVMCIERVVCILRINNYEESSRPVIVVFTLTLLTTVCAIAFYFLSIPGVDLAAGLPVATLRNEENSVMYQISKQFVALPNNRHQNDNL